MVAIETDAGVVLAGDTRTTTGGTVTSDSVQRVFDLDGAGAGAVGDPGDVDEFGRRLESELRTHEMETDTGTALNWIARTAAETATATGVEAVVGARDADGVARIRRVGPDGSVLEDATVALGSGAPVALGRLEDADLGADLDETAALARDVVAVAAERDVETGGDVDVWTLASPERDGSQLEGD